MIRKSMCVFVEQVGGEKKTSTRSQKNLSGLGRVRHKAERGQWNPGKVTGYGRTTDKSVGAQTLASFRPPAHLSQKLRLPWLHWNSSVHGLHSGAMVPCPATTSFQPQQTVPTDDGAKHSHPLHSLGPLLPNFFPFAPSLSILVTHFFLFSTKVPRAGKTTIKLIRPR